MKSETMAVTDDGHVRNTVHAALPQVLAVSIKNVLLLGYGMTLGFPTIVIPALEGDDQTEPLVLTSEQISWISECTNVLLLSSSIRILLYYIYLYACVQVLLI